MKKTKQKSNLSNLEIAAFCSQMSMVIRSGFPSIEGISMLLADAINTEEEEILQTIYDEMIDSGVFYQALERTGVFPRYMIQMVEIGEGTGTMDEVMTALARHYEREESIAQSIKGALTYPLIMIGMMLLVIVVLLTKVMPIFNQVFLQLGREMTGFSRGILVLGNTISNYTAVFIALAVLIVAAMAYFTKTVRGRAMLMKAGYHVRFVRELYEKMAACRFAGGMYLTLKSGLNQERSLEFSEKLVNNPYYRTKITNCRTKIAEGEDIAKAFVETGIFSGLYARMAYIAEKSGRLDEILDKISSQYEKEVDDKLVSFIAILEPTLVIILSVVVGMILLSVMLPLMGIMAGL